MIKGKLANEGVECLLTNQNTTNLMPHLNHMMGAGIQVLVFEDDYEKAVEILDDELNPKNENLICPQCGSSEISLGFGKNKGIKIVNIILAVISAFPMGNITPKFFCKSCGTEIK